MGQGSQPGIGRQPEGGWPEFTAPGQSAPGQPNSGQLWQQYPQPWRQYEQPWQQDEQPWQQAGAVGAGARKDRSTVIALIVIGVVVALVVATAVIVVSTFSSHRQQPVPAPAPAPSRSVSPSPSAEPATRPADALGKALESTGLSCVQANADPVINICDNRPADSFTEIRWFVDGKDMISFQLYAKDQTDQDLMLLTKRVQLLEVAGLSSTDTVKIAKALVRSKKHTSIIDARAGWGSVNVQYVKPVHSVQIFGDKLGHKKASFHGKSLRASTAAIASRVKPAGYTCTNSYGSLTCTHGRVYLSMYGDGTTMTDISVSGRTPAADRLLDDLLPTLVGGDVDVVQPLLKACMDQPFYLGAVSGYVVLGNTNYISVEAISW